jgi:DNA-binding transcriptional MerR regulator
MGKLTDKQIKRIRILKNKLYSSLSVPEIKELALLEGIQEAQQTNYLSKKGKMSKAQKIAHMRSIGMSEASIQRMLDMDEFK